MSQQRRQPKNGGRPVERVDPFDRPEGHPGAVWPSDVDVPSPALGEIRARIRELDARVAGLLARREQLTRVAFDLVDLSSAPSRSDHPQVASRTAPDPP